MAEPPDFYRILGVLPDAEDVTIRGAYLGLIQKYHPDKFQGARSIAEGKAKELNEAYAVLGSPLRRKEYDSRRASRSNSGSQAGRNNDAAEKNKKSEPRPNASSSTANQQPNASGARGQSTQTRQSNNRRFGQRAGIFFIFVIVVRLIAYVSQTMTPSTTVTASLSRNAGAIPAIISSNTDSVPEDRTAPSIISWFAKDNGDPKTYRVAELSVVLSTKSDPASQLPIPMLHLSLAGSGEIDVAGQPGSETAYANIAIVALDPTNSQNEVVFMTDSGGAHCCTEFKILEPIDGVWKKIDGGTWDGGAMMELPHDLDGDGIPDIVFRDGRFNYQFASYAGSIAPSLIFNLINGKWMDVSDQPRYAKYYQTEMATAQAGCLLHANGACAAFVAVASRLGLHDWAWQFMLDNYDPSDDWTLPKKCKIVTDNNACPSNQEIEPTGFPDALEYFLTGTEYHADPTLGPASIEQPSFDCSRVRSNDLRLVCATPQLAAADRNLAAAYVAAISNVKQPDQLKSEQRLWITERNNAPATVEALQALYDERIAVLTTLARQAHASH